MLDYRRSLNLPSYWRNVTPNWYCNPHCSKIQPQTEEIKIGADLVNAVCLWVENKASLCSTFIIVFNIYQEMPLNYATRNERYSKSNPQHYKITSSTNISRRSMSQLLTHKETKRSLTELLVGPWSNHLSITGLQFVVEGNFITYHSMYDETTNS